MIPVTWNSKYPLSGESTLFENECMKCQRKICVGTLFRIKQHFQTILLFLLKFYCFAFFRITAHIDVVRALLGQMSCSVTWESTQKKRRTCAAYAKRLLAAVIIWASTLELMTPVGKGMFQIKTVMVKNLATRVVQNFSVMLMVMMMCLRMITKRNNWAHGQTWLKGWQTSGYENYIQKKFQSGRKLNDNQTIT